MTIPSIIIAKRVENHCCIVIKRRLSVVREIVSAIGGAIGGFVMSWQIREGKNERYQPRGKPRTPSSAASGGVLNPKGNKK